MTTARLQKIKERRENTKTLWKEVRAEIINKERLQKLSQTEKHLQKSFKEEVKKFQDLLHQGKSLQDLLGTASTIVNFIQSNPTIIQEVIYAIKWPQMSYIEQAYSRLPNIYSVSGANLVLDIFKNPDPNKLSISMQLIDKLITQTLVNNETGKSTFTSEDKLKLITLVAEKIKAPQDHVQEYTIIKTAQVTSQQKIESLKIDLERIHQEHCLLLTSIEKAQQEKKQRLKLNKNYQETPHPRTNNHAAQNNKNNILPKMSVFHHKPFNLKKNQVNSTRLEIKQPRRGF